MDGELWRIWQVLYVVAAFGILSPEVPGATAWSDPHEHLHYAIFDDSHHIPGEPLTPTDYQNALGLVADSPPLQDANGKFLDPIELAGLFEGDIILKSSKEEDDLRNGIINEKQKWPNNQVPYVISSEFDSSQRGVIAKAMTEYQKRTCVTFKARSTEKDYIHIHRGNGCSSHVGRSGGAQPVSIGPGCEFTGIVEHELMHAVGFWHEQSRADRDDYVTVYFDNIQQGMEFNFRKYSWREIQNLSAPYDLSSVMHYGAYAFTKQQGRPTILPRDPNKQIGQRKGFSTWDVEKINRLYKCGSTSQKPTPTTPVQTTASPSSCEDNHRHCAYWAKQGECTKNPAWMKANCRQSCKECGRSCQDLNQHCKSWTKRGECSRNPDYMGIYCRKSCDSCPTTISGGGLVIASQKPGPACVDKEKNCAHWAKNGECSKNPKYMHKYCPNACKTC